MASDRAFKFQVATGFCNAGQQETTMRNFMAIVFAGILAAAAGYSAADEKAVKEHEEM